MFSLSIVDKLHREIADQLIIATPEWWKEARLELVYTVVDGLDHCTHTIVNNQYPRNIVIATDELFEATRRLVLYHKELGHPWKSAIFEVKQNDDAEWSFTAEFKY